MRHSPIELRHILSGPSTLPSGADYGRSAAQCFDAVKTLRSTAYTCTCYLLRLFTLVSDPRVLSNQGCQRQTLAKEHKQLSSIHFICTEVQRLPESKSTLRAGITTLEPTYTRLLPVDISPIRDQELQALRFTLDRSNVKRCASKLRAASRNQRLLMRE